jgi:hypothetical protein
MALVAALAAAVWAGPFYALVWSGVPIAIWSAQALAMAALTVIWALLPAIVGPEFPVGVRYTGVSLAMQGASVLGGFAPVVATGLLAWAHGGLWPVAGLLMVVALSSAAGSVLLRRDPVPAGGGASLPHDVVAGTGVAVAQEEPS